MTEVCTIAIARCMSS